MSGITLKEIAAASIPTPAAGKATVFLEVADGEPKYKDDAGVVTSLVGVTGATGQGVPTGGAMGTVLAKVSGTDYDTAWVAAGAGDVVGPASAVDDRICTFDLTTGKLIQDGGATIAQIDTRGRHAIYVPAGAIRPSATGGCATFTTAVTSANQPDLAYLAFDATTQEYAQFAIVMPKKWDEGTVTAVFHWSHPATVTNFGVVWDLQAVALANDDPIATAYGTAQTATDTGGTTNDYYASPETAAITIAGSPGAEELAQFRLSRVTGNGSDTMAVDAFLTGITLYITTAASTDA